MEAKTKRASDIQSKSYKLMKAGNKKGPGETRYESIQPQRKSSMIENSVNSSIVSSSNQHVMPLIKQKNSFINNTGYM